MSHVTPGAECVRKVPKKCHAYYLNYTPRNLIFKGSKSRDYRFLPSILSEMHCCEMVTRERALRSYVVNPPWLRLGVKADLNNQQCFSSTQICKNNPYFSTHTHTHTNTHTHTHVTRTQALHVNVHTHVPAHTLTHKHAHTFFIIHSLCLGSSQKW